MTYLGEPDGVAVGAGAREEVNSLLVLLVVLVLTRQVVARRLVASLVTDLRRLQQPATSHNMSQLRNSVV